MDFLQYYCSNPDEKMGCFEVKNGNKKEARKFNKLLIGNRSFFEYSHLAVSQGSNSYPQYPGFSKNGGRRIWEEVESHPANKSPSFYGSTRSGIASL
jgi:hypothetical protein